MGENEIQFDPTSRNVNIVFGDRVLGQVCLLKCFGLRFILLRCFEILQLQ